MRDKTDVKETRHQHYQLYYKNVLVEGGHLDLHSRKGVLKSAHARIIEDLDLPVDKPIDESKALDEALAHRKLTKEKLKDKKLPKGDLVLAYTNGDYVKESYRLAYAFDLYDETLTEANRVYVDAGSGAVLKSHPLSQNCFNHSHFQPKALERREPTISSSARNQSLLLAATFNSLYPRSNPIPTLEVESVQGSTNTYQLSMSTSNVTRALDTRWDSNNNVAWDDAPLTNIGLNWGSNVQQATLAHWTAWRTYQYFKNRFGLDGTDGNGNIARILISPNFNNAQWVSNERIIRIGAPTGSVLSSVDIVAHEYGHGLSSQLVAGWWDTNVETGALNEGFSDIIGTAIERELYPTGSSNQIWNYRLGEDVLLSRDMADPHSLTQVLRDRYGSIRAVLGYPATYQEQGFWDSENESHHNSTVLGKWFHTLTTGQGPNGINIAPISFDDAMQVVYWGLDNYIYGDYGYPSAAQALRTAAGALFGQCSPQQNAVIAALNAVNLAVGPCTPDCNYAAVNITPSNVNCSQAMTLSTNCNAANANNSNVWTCQNVTYSFEGPNVPYNSSTNSSVNVTAPATSGTYQYTLKMSKPGSGCYTRTYVFNVNVNCTPTPNCDFSSGPRYVGTWNGLTVQIRRISGKNVLVTAIPNSSTDKYYPRGDNFWGSFSVDPGAVGLQSCLNAGSTGWGGLSLPSGVYPPSGYYQGTEQDGAVYFAQNGTNPVNPCDVSPRQVGTWNGLNVQIRTFPNGVHALVTAVPGSSNDKYFPRGDNFWDNFTKNAGADQYRSCLNAGNTNWWGLEKPGSVSPPSGYQQGTMSDGAIYFSTNGLRVAATEPTEESVSLVQVHPNPAQDEVTVSFVLKEAGDVPVRLLDLQGRVQQSVVYKGIAGRNERVLKVASLPTGLYAVEVLLEQQRIIQKLVKE